MSEKLSLANFRGVIINMYVMFNLSSSFSISINLKMKNPNQLFVSKKQETDCRTNVSKHSIF